ncbi:MAG: phosphopantothenate---cysteine ligase [Chthoniobacter sp.]|jgi:phosphopantothenoylcysteine synthetase/decarboxylase|nr:phosphopantothenate---cysteine ligase [Chthoniobacter sp.]
MRVVVTCGPSYEPIDEVRRLTNFSTGELGVVLANQLAGAGCEVLCFKGVGATWPGRVEGGQVIPFATNASLRAELEAIEDRAKVAAVFHAAALCDYSVKSIRTSEGTELAAAKIPSRAGELVLTLVPAEKLIAGLRALFPASRIVGWKFELNGDRAGAILAAERQLMVCETDACVLNGAAYGSGFGFLEKNGAMVHCADKAELSKFLVQWLGRGA